MEGSVAPVTGVGGGLGVPFDEVWPDARFFNGEPSVRACSCVTVTTGETAMLKLLGKA